MGTYLVMRFLGYLLLAFTLCGVSYVGLGSDLLMPALDGAARQPLFVVLILWFLFASWLVCAVITQILVRETDGGQGPQNGNIARKLSKDENSNFKEARYAAE